MDADFCRRRVSNPGSKRLVWVVVRVSGFACTTWATRPNNPRQPNPPWQPWHPGQPKPPRHPTPRQAELYEGDADYPSRLHCMVRCWRTSADIGRSLAQIGQVLTTSANKVGPTRRMFGQLRPQSRPPKQRFGNLWTTSKLAGIAWGNFFPGTRGEQLSHTCPGTLHMLPQSASKEPGTPHPKLTSDQRWRGSGEM